MPIITLSRTFNRFFDSEKSSGILLILCTTKGNIDLFEPGKQKEFDKASVVAAVLDSCEPSRCSA